MTDFSKMSKAQMEDLLGPNDKMSLKQRVRISIMTQESRGWPTHDGKNLNRTAYITASEASKCARSLAFGKSAERKVVPVEHYWDNLTDDEFNAALLSMPNNDMRGIFERGNTIESWLVGHLAAMCQEDEYFLALGDEQISFYDDHTRTSGTPDGIYVNKATKTWRGLEFKSTQNPIAAPRDNHVTQLGHNMGLIDLLAKEGELDDCLGFPISEYECEGGNLLYVDACNYLEMKEFWTSFSVEALAMSATKAAKVFVMDKTGAFVIEDGLPAIRDPKTVEPEGLENNGCYFCEHKAACRVIEEGKKHTETASKLRTMIDRRAKSLPEAIKMPTFNVDTPKKEVAKRLHEYNDARQDEAAAKKIKEAVKKAVTPWINEQENCTATFEDNGFTFTVSNKDVTRAGGYDMDAIAAALEEHGLKIATFKKPDGKSPTFTVSVKKIKEA